MSWASNLICMITALLALTACSATGIAAPAEGPKAQIALTYDDTMSSHLDIAVPQLNKHGFKGTFYLSFAQGAAHDRIEDWRAIAKNGHELGNHTLTHPCKKDAPDRDWVTPDRDLNLYTENRLLEELRITNLILKMIDGETVRTFAYTCGDMDINGASFIDALRPLFIAARTVSPAPSEDLFLFPSRGGTTGATAEALIAYVDQLIATGETGSILFHGIGGDYAITDADVHAKLLDYLAANRDKIKVDTVRNIATKTLSE